MAASVRNVARDKLAAGRDARFMIAGAASRTAFMPKAVPC